MTSNISIDTLRTTSGYLVATFLATVGLTSIINPVARSTNFGIPARSDDKTTLAFLRPLGARDLALGLTIGTFMFNGDRKHAGLVALIALVTPAMDAWAVWSFHGRLTEAWGHVFGAGLVGGLGFWLIR